MIYKFFNFIIFKGNLRFDFCFKQALIQGLKTIKNRLKVFKTVITIKAADFIESIFMASIFASHYLHSHQIFDRNYFAIRVAFFLQIYQSLQILVQTQSLSQAEYFDRIFLG